MKSIILILFAALTSITPINVQEIEKMSGTYVGFKDGVYVFTDRNGQTLAFNHLSGKAQATYDLMDDAFVNKQFFIMFTVVTDLDEQGQEIPVLTIEDLVMPL